MASLAECSGERPPARRLHHDGRGLGEFFCIFPKASLLSLSPSQKQHQLKIYGEKATLFRWKLVLCASWLVINSLSVLSLVVATCGSRGHYSWCLVQYCSL